MLNILEATHTNLTFDPRHCRVICPHCNKRDALYGNPSKIANKLGVYVICEHCAETYLIPNVT